MLIKAINKHIIHAKKSQNHEVVDTLDWKESNIGVVLFLPPLKIKFIFQMKHNLKCFSTILKL